MSTFFTKKELSDVVERLALYPPYHGCRSRVVCNPLFLCYRIIL